MYLIQILLPLYDNGGHLFSHHEYLTVRNELAERFGGITSYMRSPAEGLWKESPSQTVQDDIVIYEVMTECLDRHWWENYRNRLAGKFRQDMLIVRVSVVELL